MITQATSLGLFGWDIIYNRLMQAQVFGANIKCMQLCYKTTKEKTNTYPDIHITYIRYYNIKYYYDPLHSASKNNINRVASYSVTT